LPRDSISVGFVFFRDVEDAEPYRIVPAASFDAAITTLREQANTKQMIGGGDPPEPVLDALVTAATEYQWDVPGSQILPQRIAITVLNTDAKPETIGMSKVGSRGQTPAQVASLLKQNFIHVLAFQAGSDDLGNLAKTLDEVATITGGEYYSWEDSEKARGF